MLPDTPLSLHAAYIAIVTTVDAHDDMNFKQRSMLMALLMVALFVYIATKTQKAAVGKSQPPAAG